VSRPRKAAAPKKAAETTVRRSRGRLPRRKPGADMTGRDEMGLFIGPNPHAFKSGAEWNGNAGGSSAKGARLTPALIRALNRELRAKFPDGTPRKVVDQLAANIVKQALGKGMTAVSAFKAIADLTDGTKLRIETPDLSGLAGLTDEELLAARRAHLKRGTDGSGQ
jgi:hypothetical protein